MDWAVGAAAGRPHSNRLAPQAGSSAPLVSDARAQEGQSHGFAPPARCHLGSIGRKPWGFSGEIEIRWAAASRDGCWVDRDAMGRPQAARTGAWRELASC